MGVEEELKAVDDGIKAALTEKDAAKAVGFHDVNVVSIRADLPPGIGIDACKEGIKGLIEVGYDPSVLTISPVKSWQDGDFAFQVKKWSGDFGGGPMSGNSVVVYKKVDGQWKVLINASV